MKSNTLSIQNNLLKLLIIPLSFFTLFIFIGIYYILNNKVNKHFDNRLYATAQSIEQNIGVANSKLIIDFPRFSIDLLSSTDEGLVYYSVLDEENRLLIGHKYLAKKDLLKEDKFFYDTSFDNEELRALIYKAFIYSDGKVYVAYITVAETNEERNNTINEVLIILLIILLTVSLFSLLITLFAVKKGLNPLYKLEKIIKKRDDRNLDPIIFKTPSEITNVVKSMNLLLKRSRENIEYLEQFNSDISHQLRTPLSELKIKIQEDNKDKNSMVELVNSMSYITEQLLLYAKTNPNVVNINRFTLLNINDFLKEYCLKIAPRVYKNSFELAFLNIEEEVFIYGDEILLESMLDNIVDNAIKYARDEFNKPLGVITIEIRKENDKLSIYVKDQGKGLKESELTNIFKRAYRVDTTTKGSGLGLSIVKQIASIHGGNIKAYNDEGLVISISLGLNSYNS